jgi:hypothetical protein
VQCIPKRPPYVLRCTSELQGEILCWATHVGRVCLPPQNLRRVALQSEPDQTFDAGGPRPAASRIGAFPAGAATKPGGSGVAPSVLTQAGTAATAPAARHVRGDAPRLARLSSLAADRRLDFHPQNGRRRHDENRRPFSNYVDVRPSLSRLRRSTRHTQQHCVTTFASPPRT